MNPAVVGVIVSYIIQALVWVWRKAWPFVVTFAALKFSRSKTGQDLLWSMVRPLFSTYAGARVTTLWAEYHPYYAIANAWAPLDLCAELLAAYLTFNATFAAAKWMQRISDKAK